MVDVHKYIEEHKQEYFREIVESGRLLMLKATIRNACDGDRYTRRVLLTRERVTIQELLDASEQIDSE